MAVPDNDPDRRDVARHPSGGTPLPEAPVVSFASDNTAAVAPEVLAALADANTPSARGYGDDPWSAAVHERFADLLGRPVEMALCWGGTGANVVGLASVLESHQAIVCTEHAHIATDECGAPTRFTGAMLLTAPSSDGKLEPSAIRASAAQLGNVHHPQPGVVSISQTTELGTVYSTAEIAAVTEAAHEAGMVVHLDGARLANAVAATGVDLATMVCDTGVDVLTWGATKNGAMYGEVVLWLRPELARRAPFVHKQAAQLPSKARYVAAQILALLDDDLWLRQATHANAMASRLAERVAEIDGVRLARVPEANAVFAFVDPERVAELQGWSFFWPWDPAQGLVRWMTHFATTTDDVDRFATGIAAILSRS